MSLIDKDKAVSAIATYLFVNDAIRGGVKVADYKVFAETILKDVPVADAIPRDYYEKVVEELCRKHTEEIASMPSVVRCKECKYWQDQAEWIAEVPICKRDGFVMIVGEDDYCSYGERKGDD